MTSYGSPEVGFSQETYSNPFLSPNQQSQTQPVSFPNGVNPRIVNNPPDSLPNYGPSGPFNNNNLADQPEGELVSTQVEGEEEVREQKPVTKQTDPPASSTRAPSSSKGKKSNKNTGKDLTGEDDNYDDSATTTIEPIFPGYEDVDYDQANYQYDDSDVKDFPGLPGYLDTQGTYGNRPPPDLTILRQPVVNGQNDLGSYTPKQDNNKEVKTDKSQPDAKKVQAADEKSKSPTKQENYNPKSDKPKQKEKGNKKVEAVKDVEELNQDVGGEERDEDVEDDAEQNQEIKGQQQESDQNSDRLPQSNDNDLFNEYESNSQPEAEDEEEDVEDGNEVEDEEELEGEEDEDVRPGPGGSTTEAAFISVPLLIEEVGGKDDGDEDGSGDPTVILAGSPDDAKQPDTGYGAPGVRKGRENEAGEFHQFLVESPNAKRQADWSQRVRERQRKRVWRQFQLD